MKLKSLSRVLAVVLCLMLLVSCIPFQASAETTPEAISMVAGDVTKEFVPADTETESTDPGIAWVDSNGNLNAMKAGTATITVKAADKDPAEYTVTVTDYSDGSPVVGNLKILARFNDSMQFYDGHVYLLFTSYQDGVTLNVPDLYGAYAIDDVYYKDINESIANGSNHTGKDSEKYFKFTNSKSVTLNRGEIVTIGMYRGFDLTVPQAALGVIKNSSAWTTLQSTGKAAVIETIFTYLNEGRIATDEALAKIKAAFEEVGLDYTKVLDGVVEGGVCFNRELYNQKLEWDQYENVTYDLDITDTQFNTMAMYLRGNLNKFNILKNSCATVALRAWNAAVGTRNGEDTSYKLVSASDGIFKYMDAPKGVRDNIRNTLPGYYLNNSEGVAEPGAGYQDDTCWVYVSAPKNVAPVNYVYDNDIFTIDGSRTKIADVMNAAKGDASYLYNKDEQDVNVNVKVSGVYTANTIKGQVSEIGFDVNGTAFKADSQTEFKDGVWIKVKVPPIEGGNYYVTSGNNTLPSVYEDGAVSFKTNSLPVNFDIKSSADDAKNILNTVIVNGDAVDEDTKTEIYYKNGDDKVMLDAKAEVPAGKTVYVKSTISKDEYKYILTDITLNGKSFFNNDNFDADEGAYYTVMPAEYSTLSVKYDRAVISATKNYTIQIGAGDTIDISDYTELKINGAPADGKVVWQTFFSNDDVVEVNGGKLTALKEGETIVWACTEANENIGVLYEVCVYENADDMVKVTYDEANTDYFLSYQKEDGEEDLIPYSGFLVKKGTKVEVDPMPTTAKAVLCILANNKYSASDIIKVEEDTNIKVLFAEAEVKGMPKEIKLDKKGDTYQLNAETYYTGLLQFITPFDTSIEYVSSDPIISVDQTGLITVTGDVPEDGKSVIVTAYAGSSDRMVRAQTKVVLGDYKGSKIVGLVTISGRHITMDELVPHGAFTFTTYEDLDIDMSYNDYYRPNDKYNDLMLDYMKHPENYNSDPALCNDNELGLEDRNSYFDEYNNGAMSAPSTISLAAGESFSISNYGFDPTQFDTLRKSLAGGYIGRTSEETQELVRQMYLFTDNRDEFDASVSFDTMLVTIAKLYKYNKETGEYGADGHSQGGMEVNREIYNQFRRNDSQLPNNYYQVEITADELEMLKSYVANPNNNYYSLLGMNCATGVVKAWNTTFSDRPELWLEGNYTGISADPVSLAAEIGLMKYRKGIENGKSGTDFTPHTIRYTDEILDTVEKIDAIGEVEFTDDCKAKIDAAREAYDALTSVEKERVRNHDVLTDAEKAYEDLQKAADAEKMAEEIAAFKQYKIDKILEAELLSEADDPLTCDLAIASAQLDISNTQYDTSKSLDENKAVIDGIMDTLKQRLDNLRDPEPEPEPEPVTPGDVNGDGVADIMDAIEIQKFTANKAELTPEQLLAADVNGDGTVDILDAMKIQKEVSGKA